MRLSGDDEERSTGSMPVMYMILAVGVFILFILLVVYFTNGGGRTPRRGTGSAARATQAPDVSEDGEETGEGGGDLDTLYKENRLRAEDLDIWNMYQDSTLIVEEKPSPSPSPEASHEPTEEEKAADGRHTEVTYRDGTKEWIEISEDIPLYKYDLTNMKITNGKMEYILDGEKCSWLGIELSKDSGKVNFESLHDNGVDFVMLKLGSRGYETGLLNLDESFVSNIAAAKKAGMEIGIIFFSQAVNTQEAVAEAEFVINNLEGYEISYPIAFDMEYIPNDESRIDTLDEEQKTRIAEAFLDRIESEGYRGILYGNKSWLLTELVPDKLLLEYDVLLSNQEPVPNYPYEFKMWKYAVNQEVYGVEKKVAYIISFVDYTRK